MNKTFVGMLLVAATIIVFSLLPAGASLESATGRWVPRGNNQYLWLDTSGRTDGQLYNWYSGHYGQYYSKVVRSLTPQEVQQINGPVEGAQQAQQQEQQAAQYQQQQVQNVYGEGRGAPEVGWRVRGLAMLSQAQEQQHFESFLDRIVPSKNSQSYAQPDNQGYNVQSPYNAGQSQSVNASQYGGYGSGVNVMLGQLPQQQGNTTYGSLDPTFNTFADPLRTFDYGATLNQLIQMSAQYQAGGSRLNSELLQTVRAMSEHARILKEVETHWQGKMGVMRLLRDIEPRPSTTQTVQIRTDSGGQSTYEVFNGNGQPNGSGPGGPPPGVPGQNGDINGGPGGAPPGQQSLTAEDQRFLGIVSKKCLSCHGADKPAGNLRLGRGTLVDFSGLDERQAGEVFKRVEAGTMPPPSNGALPEDEKALFRKIGEKMAGPAQ